MQRHGWGGSPCQTRSQPPPATAPVEVTILGRHETPNLKKETAQKTKVMTSHVTHAKSYRGGIHCKQEDLSGSELEKKAGCRLNREKKGGSERGREEERLWEEAGRGRG
jgi:hypothetical protein